MAHKYVELANEVDSGIRGLFAAAPGPMRAYAKLAEEASKDGALDARTKELMAAAISVAVRCEGCIAYHTRAAVRLGATREQFVEAMAVAVELGGGPSAVYGAEALKAYDQFAESK